MAKLYADVDGKILRFLKTDEEEDRFLDPPLGAVDTLAFDLETNLTIGQLIDTDSNRCRLLNGQFRYDGVAQAINSPSGVVTEYRRLQQFLTKLMNDENLSAAELRALLRIIIRFMLRHRG